MKTETIQFRTSAETKIKIKKIAEKEHRTISNLLEIIIEKELKAKEGKAYD